MILCNNILAHITQYLNIKELSYILLYIPSLKDDIGKLYCLSHNIFSGLKSNYNISTYNYSDTILYFQNNYIYRCYHCMKILTGPYYLVICPCIINIIGGDIVYTKYHIDCIKKIQTAELRSSQNGKMKLINCQFCGVGRMCFMCNLYS